MYYLSFHFYENALNGLMIQDLQVVKYYLTIDFTYHYYVKPLLF